MVCITPTIKNTDFFFFLRKIKKSCIEISFVYSVLDIKPHKNNSNFNWIDLLRLK